MIRNEFPNWKKSSKTNKSSMKARSVSTVSALLGGLVFLSGVVSADFDGKSKNGLPRLSNDLRTPVRMASVANENSSVPSGYDVTDANLPDSVEKYKDTTEGRITYGMVKLADGTVLTNSFDKNTKDLYVT